MPAPTACKIQGAATRGRQCRVSGRNAFAIIRELGEDCARSVPFVIENREQDAVENKPGAIAWLTEDDVAERLRLQRNAAGV